MTRLDRYILRQIATPTLAALAIVGFMAVGIRIAQYRRDMPMELLTATDVSRLSVLFMPSLIALVIPVTLLLGILLAFGRLAQLGEIIAIKAAGISLRRTVAPLIVLASLLTALTFLVQDRIQPWAIARAYALIYSELPQRATLMVFPAGMIHEYEGWHVYFERKDTESLTFQNLDIVQPNEGQGVTVIHAESAAFAIDEGGHTLTLRAASVIPPNGAMFFSDEFVLAIPPPSTNEVRAARRASTLLELFETERDLNANYSPRSGSLATHSLREDLRKIRQEIAERISGPLAVLAVSVVGAPLGVRARRGGRSYTFAAGFLVILVYYTLQIALTPPVVRSLSTHITNAMIPNAVLFLAGIVLLWRVDRV